MSRHKEIGWGEIVTVCVIILAIIALFKFLFWVCVVAVIVGIIWLIINFYNDDHEYSWIPVLLIIGGIIIGFISYGIGYQFEKSDIGKPIVESAKTIVNTDNQIKEIQENATNQIIGSISNIPK